MKHPFIDLAVLLKLYAKGSVCWFTWVIGQEAAGVVLQLLHEADLAVVTETVEVPLTQNEDGGGGVGEGGHAEVQALFSQDERPVGLRENYSTLYSQFFSFKRTSVTYSVSDRSAVWAALLHREFTHLLKSISVVFPFKGGRNLDTCVWAPWMKTCDLCLLAFWCFCAAVGKFKCSEVLYMIPPECMWYMAGVLKGEGISPNRYSIHPAALESGTHERSMWFKVMGK